MTPTIAIGLLTCNRERYTLRTLETLALHNDLSRFILVHADDASELPDNCDMASDFGFKEQFRSHKREGQFAMLKCLLAMARRKGAEWFLYLENDWEWVRPFPWDVMDFADVRDDWPDKRPYPKRLQCLRLYGALKGRTGPRLEAGKHFMGTRLPIDWQPTVEPSPPGYEAACAHWAGPPSVTHMSFAEYLENFSSFKQISEGYWPMTWRPTENCVWHIGEQQTTEWKA